MNNPSEEHGHARATRIWAALVGALIGAGFTAILFAAPKADRPGGPLAGVVLIDLTHELREGIPAYPGTPPFVLRNEATLQEGYYMNSLQMSEHTGTHIDAPSHFIERGKTVDELSLPGLFGPLVVIDVEDDAQDNPDLLVSLSHIQEHESCYGPIPQGAFVVAHTGWWRKWPNADEYVNLDAEGVPHFPGFSSETARFLAAERNVAGMGIDTLSTDAGRSESFPQHHIFLGQDRVNIENLCNLDQVPAQGAYLLLAAIKIKGGSGAPVRAIAFVPKR